MNAIIQWFAGKKTIICFALVAIAGALFALGYINYSQLIGFTTVVGGLGGISLRVAMNKTNQ